MKKFYCNGKIVYLNNKHSALTAKILLREVGLAGSFDHVCQALDVDQDMLEVPLDFLGVASEVENQVTDKEGVAVPDFIFGMEEDADPDCYVLPNGKSAPYGLTGVEVAALPHDAVLYTVSLYEPGGVFELEKDLRSSKELLMAVDRDLVFATREKAVEAYNALFGDLYGTI